MPAELDVVVLGGGGHVGLPLSLAFAQAGLRVGIYDAIYGPLGALVGLGMFAYYSGIVFILGAEFTAALRSH